MGKRNGFGKKKEKDKKKSQAASKLGYSSST